VADDEGSLVAVVAHRLLNDLTVVRGLLAEARAELPSTPDCGRAADLLDACEAKTSDVIGDLRRYAALGAPDEPPVQLIDLDEQPPDRTRPQP